jgi:hypothetical protein
MAKSSLKYVVVHGNAFFAIKTKNLQNLNSKKAVSHVLLMSSTSIIVGKKIVHEGDQH